MTARAVNWLSVRFLLPVAVILSIVLAVVGVRAFASVNNNAEYAGKSWVIQGTYQDLTPDLITKGNVARYKGNLPADDALNGKTYVSNLKDKYQVTSGAPIEFQVGRLVMFPRSSRVRVDGLLVEKDGNLEVVYTAEKGTLKPVTEDSVNAERFTGIASIVGAVLVLLLGMGFAVWLNRRSRDVEYEDLGRSGGGRALGVLNLEDWPVDVLLREPVSGARGVAEAVGSFFALAHEVS